MSDSSFIPFYLCVTSLANVGSYRMTLIPKKHAWDDSGICAGVIEPSTLEASHTWPEVELGWLGINGSLGTSEERRRNCKHVMRCWILIHNLALSFGLAHEFKVSTTLVLKDLGQSTQVFFHPCQRCQIGANTSRLASGRQQRLAHYIQNQFDK